MIQKLGVIVNIFINSNTGSTVVRINKLVDQKMRKEISTTSNCDST